MGLHHNTAAIRKYFKVSASVYSPASGATETYNSPCYTLQAGQHGSWTSEWDDPVIRVNWVRVQPDPGIKASFHLSASLKPGC